MSPVGTVKRKWDSIVVDRNDQIIKIIEVIGPIPSEKLKMLDNG
jgi:hypothetical protein